MLMMLAPDFYTSDWKILNRRVGERHSILRYVFAHFTAVKDVICNFFDACLCKI